jgi:hypothetical protein
MRDGIQFGLAMSIMVCYFVRNGSFSGAQGRSEEAASPSTSFLTSGILSVNYKIV